MATIDIPQDIDLRIDRLAAETGYSRAMLLGELWRMGIDDLEDYFQAAKASDDIRAGRARVVSSEEAWAELGLDD